MQNVEYQNLVCITCLAHIMCFHSYLNEYGIFVISLSCDSTTFFQLCLLIIIDCIGRMSPLLALWLLCYGRVNYVTNTVNSVTTMSTLLPRQKGKK